MISETGSVDALLRPPAFSPFGPATTIDHSRLDRLDPMQNQLCRVCEEPAAGFHFGAFTCEGCKSFFGRTCNNQSVIAECKNNYRCVVDKKNRTACKACRLRKCLMVGMSKSGSRYGRRSNWFKIHCLMQQNLHGQMGSPPSSSKSPPSSSSAATPTSTSSAPTVSSSFGQGAPAFSLWHSPKASSPDSLSRSSPDHPPTMVPRFPTAPVATPSSPFKNLMLPLSPVGETEKSPLSPPIIPTSVASSPALASLYSHFPFMSAAFPGIPLHKQAFLSPLLAHPGLWQMATAAAAARQQQQQQHSLLRPDLDLLAEHRALLEKFSASAAAPTSPTPPSTPSAAAAAAAAAMAAAAAAAAAMASANASSPPSSHELLLRASSSPSRACSASPSDDHSASSPEPPQQTPMDLSRSKKLFSAMERFKSDVNRNNLVSSEKDSPSPASDNDSSSVLDLCSNKS